MQVFKVFLKIAKSKIGTVLMMIGILMIIVILTGGSSDGKDKSFISTKIRVAVIDEDNSEESKALTEFIGKVHDLREVKNDKEVILDKLFYQQLGYVLVIKDGYGEKLAAGETEGLFENYKDPGTYSASFFENTLNEYVSAVRGYEAGGNDFKAASEKAVEAVTAKVEVKVEDGSGNTEIVSSAKYSEAYRILPYIIIAIMVEALCPILLTLNSTEIKKRTDCSCISSTSQTLQIFLGSALFVVGIWAIINAVAFGVSGGSFTARECMNLLNTFVFTLVGTGIALLVASFNPAANVVNIIGTCVGLGMSFICGSFVPQNMLGEGVLTAAKFLPAYWYVKTNEIISGSGVVSGGYDVKEVFICIGIQLLFAAALFALVVVITRSRRGKPVKA